MLSFNDTATTEIYTLSLHVALPICELGAHGYRVVHAAGGREGLRLAREVRPDANTLHVIMPELDGWAVLRELKADTDLSRDRKSKRLNSSHATIPYAVFRLNNTRPV